MENTELLNTINAKLDEVVLLLKAKTSPNSLVSVSGGMELKGDVISGEFHVTTEPKPWSSGKGAFVSCKPEGDPTGDWYSIGITYATSEKVAPGYFPKKGDVLFIRGNYKEEEKNGKVYKSIFAFSVKPKQLPLNTNQAAVEDNEDVPF